MTVTVTVTAGVPPTIHQAPSHPPPQILNYYRYIIIVSTLPPTSPPLLHHYSIHQVNRISRKLFHSTALILKSIIHSFLFSYRVLLPTGPPPAQNTSRLAHSSGARTQSHSLHSTPRLSDRSIQSFILCCLLHLISNLATMLLPSALPCDMRRSSTRSRFTPNRLFSTPPPSDNDFFPSSNGLLGTCRALQSLLSGSPAPSSRRAKPDRLQSPFHLASSTSTTSSTRPRKPKTQTRTRPSSPKPSPKPSRGANKRTRASYEADSDADSEDHTPRARFSTPKRRRYVPYDLPLGLSQSDFYSLNSPPTTQSPHSPAQQRQQELCDEVRAPLPPSPSPSSQSQFDPDAALPSIEETGPDSWTSEDDRQLVEVVLEKFQLSKRDWDECARQLGRDQDSIGRRWEALIGEGDVGLRRGRRMVRGRIDETWL